MLGISLLETHEAVGVLLIACFVGANVVGTAIWCRRNGIDAYRGFQMLILVLLLANAIAFVGADLLGALAVLGSPRGRPRLVYLVLLIFPALMLLFHFLRTGGFGRFGGSPPVGPAEELKSFSSLDPTLSSEGITREDNAWRVTCAGKDETISLFEVAHPDVGECMLIYRARIRSKGVGGRAYLEMWCRFAAGREFFSKGFAFHEPVTGTTEWTVCETPFYLKRGQKPSLVTLNLVVQGGGEVWIKDVQLLRAPFVKAKPEDTSGK